MEKNFEWYLKHQQELVEQYSGRVLLIKDCRVLSAHESELEAIHAASDQYPPGSVLIQRCEPGEDSFTETHHSRVCSA